MHNPQRILFYESNLDETVGGSHRALHDLVVRLDRNRFHAHVVFGVENAFADRLRHRGIDVEIWEVPVQEAAEGEKGGSRATRARRLWTRIRNRSRFLKSRKAALLHLNNSPFQGHKDWMPAAKLAGVPCVVSMRGDARRPTGRIDDLLARGFDRILPVSHYVRNGSSLSRVPSHRIQTVRDGVDCEAIRDSISMESRDGTRAAWDIPTDGVLAVLPGTVRRWKGQHVLIEALALLHPTIRNRLKVLIVGGWGADDRDYHQEILQRIREHHLEDQVILTGHRDDLPALLHASDFALHTSVLPEPFGLVITEALAAGTPVLAAGSGGAAEILASGGGLLHTPGDADSLARKISDLLSSPEILLEMRKEAGTIADSFSITNTVSAISSIYDDLLL